MANKIEEILQIDVELSKTELDLLGEIFSNPLVIKYLKIVGKNDLSELATLSISGMDDSEVAKKHAHINGRLSTLVTLLSISDNFKGATS